MYPSEPEPIDTLLHARWIVPVEPAGTVYEDHAIALKAGRILDILPSTEADERYSPQESLRFAQHILIPGLINAHTHAAMTLFRGLADDKPLMEWLNHHIWPAEKQWATGDFVRDGVRLAIAEMLRGGTTCFNDMYFFPDQAAAVAAEAGIRAVIGLIVLDFPTLWAKDSHDYLVKGEQLHDELRHHPLIRTAFAPHAPYSVSDEPLKRVGVLAEVLDIPVHMHVHETRQEVSEAWEGRGDRPLARLDRLGLLSPRFQAVHMTQLDEAEIERVSEYGVHVVHCPHSNLKLASGFCPVARLARAGVNVAIGTDGAASNNRLDMLSEMRTAALLAKAVAEDACAVPAGLALQMATLNGARALGIDDITGSLLPGKMADIVALDLGGCETQPIYDPVSQIVYAAGREQVSDVWIAGKRVLQDRRLQTLDEEAILTSARDWRAKIVGL
jgi:5-methylthioadenosine/S-adenosylhomocysteine deaminase